MSTVLLAEVVHYSGMHCIHARSHAQRGALQWHHFREMYSQTRERKLHFTVGMIPDVF